MSQLDPIPYPDAQLRSILTARSSISATTTAAANGWSDRDRTTEMLKGIVGKRLTYRRTNEGAHQQA